jgi:hypothetical protein
MHRVVPLFIMSRLDPFGHCIALLAWPGLLLAGRSYVLGLASQHLSAGLVGNRQM